MEYVHARMCAGDRIWGGAEGGWGIDIHGAGGGALRSGTRHDSAPCAYNGARRRCDDGINCGRGDVLSPLLLAHFMFFEYFSGAYQVASSVREGFSHCSDVTHVY